MPLYGRRRSKPHPGAGIDWTAPLSQGLMGFYALNEGAGPTVHDAAGNLDLAAYAGTPWGSGSQGFGLSCTSASNGAYALLPANLRVQFPITVAAGYRTTATGAAGHVFGLDNGAAGYPWMVYQSAGAVKMHAQGTSFLVTGYTPAVGADSVVAANFVGGAATVPFYANGSLFASPAGTPSASWSYPATPYLTVANSPGDAAAARILVYWAAWWARALSATEHAQLAADPWSVFGPPRSYFLMRPSGVAATLVRRTLSDRAGSRGVA